MFFIPSNPDSSTALSTITDRLRTTCADGQLIPTGHWAADHRLMRDTPSCLPSASVSTSQRQLKPQYLQFLSLSYYPNHAFIYKTEEAAAAHNQGSPSVSATSTHSQGGGGKSVTNVQQSQSQPQPQPQSQSQSQSQFHSAPTHNSDSQIRIENSSMIMTTIPLPSYTTLFNHFVYACQPFWCHRHTVTVTAGLVYDVGDFRVRLGDVKQKQPTSKARGAVVEIEWKGPSLVDSIVSQQQKEQRAAAQETNKTVGLSSSHVGHDVDSTGEVHELDQFSFSSLLLQVEDADIDAEFAATATLIREFWASLGIDGAREAILVPDLGKEVKARLRLLKQQQQHKKDGQDQSQRISSSSTKTFPYVRHAVDIWDKGKQDDPDPEAGVDLARQFMEIFRFHR